ncbi:glycosyltransferase family 2 protein [Joostella sp.]|uniref:glycosyltransferase family 2 protein n=1 Tax=Joostella sp. TaxID=2231138 RepID=UPI003A93CFD2
MTIALIIATYNWSQALTLVLESVAKQTFVPDEIYIADDGSKPLTKEVILNFIKKNKHLNIHHIWHEDLGHRKCISLNMCLKKIKSDYVVQTDGDCILHKNFIEDHSYFAKKRQFICGNRVMLSKVITNQLIQKKIPPSLLALNFGGKFNFKYQYRNYKLAKKKSITSKKNRESVPFGCNMSYWKSDAIKINGYNELFSGWGPEDSEFTQRLSNANINMLQIKHAAIIYHLYHEILSKNMLEYNISILEDTISKKTTKCNKGIIHF